jgi:hypothetical protein
MNDQALKYIVDGQVSTMFGIVAVARQFAETLVSKGILSVAEAQSTLSNIAEELRNDGDANDGKYADATSR